MFCVSFTTLQSFLTLSFFREIPSVVQTKSKKSSGKKEVKNAVHVSGQKSTWFFVILIVSVFFSYTPVFEADFVNWDDEDYVLNNPDIQSFSNLKELLTEPVQGNYHPVTMLSLALNFSLTGKKASSYHILNLLLHIINTILVFIFIRKLVIGKIWMAFIVALLFGIHPLHVESVAWVSERKDLLYSLFFICGMIVYLDYLEKRKFSSLVFTFMFFLLSILSKPAAIIFPIVLITLDYYKSTLNSLRVYLEKVPFLLVSILMGLLTLQGQSETGATAFAAVYGLGDRLIFACYGIMMYILKSLLPLELCAFYPLPDSTDSLPASYYLSIGFFLLLVLAFIRSIQKHKLFAFVILFYLINLALVLQILPVGNAIIADRYAYLPLLAVMIVPGFYFQKWVDSNNGKVPAFAVVLLSILSFICIFLSNKQAATWKNGQTLWDQAIKVQPSSRAYILRGLLYKQDGNSDQAFRCYTKAIELGTKEPDAWVNRGNIYFASKVYDKAIADYSFCISLKPTHLKAHENRGAAYASIGKTDLALSDLNQAIILDPLSTNAIASRAKLLSSMGRYPEAVEDFNRYFSLTADPTGDLWSFAAVANYNLTKYTEALYCYDQALKIRETGMFYFNRSKILEIMGRKSEAYRDAQKAGQLGVQVDPAYLQSLQ